MAKTPSAPVHLPGSVPLDGPSATDEELVAGVLARRPAAFDAIYVRYARPAFSLALRILGDAEFAEDVVQEVFLALWQNPARYDPARGGLGTWLLSLTHHKAVDAVRREEAQHRRCRDVLGLDLMARQYTTVDDVVWSGLRRERLRRGLAALPLAQRQVLVLAYFGGHTQAEIAVLTDTALGTVKTRTLLGLRRLAATLDSPLAATLGPRQAPTARSARSRRSTARFSTAGSPPGQ